MCASTSQNQGRDFNSFTAKLTVLAPFCSIGRVDEPACTAQGASPANEPLFAGAIDVQALLHSLQIRTVGIKFLGVRGL